MNIKKDWKGKENLFIVDVSAVMRSNFIPVEQTTFGANYGKFRREPMTFEVDGEEMNTSAMYGLFRLFSKYKDIEADYIFCFDTPGNLLKKVDQNYKANRVKMGNEYFDQVNTAMKILKESGYAVLAAGGYEADHMIHEAVIQNERLYDNIGVITNDRDLSCLVSDNVAWVNVLQTKSDITKDNYVDELKCPYNSILLKKCMVGDKSDNIAGIRLFGEVAFERFFNEEGLHDQVIRGNEIDIIKATDLLSDDKKGQALHALDLILPLKVNVDARANRDVNRLMMQAFLKKFGMNSIVPVFS